MSAELISVIIRTKDRRNFIAEAIESVIDQTYRPLELIIVNDGGESIAELVMQYSEQITLRYFDLEKNFGRSYAANFGIAQANGQYLSFLDDDDILYPFHFTELIDNFDNDKDIIYADALKAVQEKSEQSYLTVDYFLEYSEEFSLAKLQKGNFIPLQCLLFKKDVFEQVKFNEEYHCLEDWDVLLSCATVFTFQHYQQITSEYRYRLDCTNTSGQDLEHWAATEELISRKYFNF